MSERRRLPIGFPSDDVLMSFLAMARSHGGSTDTGELVAHIPAPDAPDGYRDRVIPCEHIEVLVARGWAVYPNESDVDPTESGLYWLNRWKEIRGV